VVRFGLPVRPVKRRFSLCLINGCAQDGSRVKANCNAMQCFGRLLFPFIPDTQMDGNFCLLGTDLAWLGLARRGGGRFTGDKTENADKV
jgi:hypothetical protein